MKKVLYFHSLTCPPCRFCERETIDKLEGVEVQKINVMENRPENKQYKVDKIPTTIILEDGDPVERFVGAVELDEIKKYL